MGKTQKTEVLCHSFTLIHCTSSVIQLHLLNIHIKVVLLAQKRVLQMK